LVTWVFGHGDLENIGKERSFDSERNE